MGHNGGTLGYEAQLDIYTQTGYVAIVLTNQDDVMMPVMRDIEQILTKNRYNKYMNQTDVLHIENPDNGPKPVGPYSQVAKIDLGNSYLLMFSGQIGVDEMGQLVSDDMAEQTAKAFDNLQALLKCYNADLSAVANIRTYLADMTKIREYGRVRLERFGDHVPTSTTIEASSLFMPGALVEMEVTAVIAKN